MRLWPFRRKSAPAAELVRMSPGDLIAAVRSRTGLPPQTCDDFTPEEDAAWRAMTPAERQDVFTPAIRQRQRDLKFGPAKRTKKDVAKS